ncbi:hypothetical protein Tco_0801224 [Tanacetum coccineum]|uniref:Uncharacterized protein n=1 Tax=Tanacetum coccineum TaxID=301880 RepID=A0ABQ4ZXP4_9ASTR
MPTKIELTLEQSQQGVSDDVLVCIKGVEGLKRNVWIRGGSQLQSSITKTKMHKSSLEPEEIIIINHIRTQSVVILFSIHSDEWKSFQSQPQTALRYKRQCCSPIPAKSDSSPHAHTQSLKVNHSTSRWLLLNKNVIGLKAQVHVKFSNSDNHKLPHHQRSSKSNKESSSEEIVNQRNIR